MSDLDHLAEGVGLPVTASGDSRSPEVLAGPRTHICWTPDGKEDQPLVVLLRWDDLAALLAERDTLRAAATALVECYEMSADDLGPDWAAFSKYVIALAKALGGVTAHDLDLSPEERLETWKFAAAEYHAERDTLRAALRQAKRDVIAIHQAGFDSKRLKACQDAIARIEEALGGVSGRQEQGRDAAA